MVHKMFVLYYNSLILSRIDYCLHIWGAAPLTSLNEIYKLQKRLGRMILNLKMDTPSVALFEKLGWMTIYERIAYQRGVFLYNILNGNGPTCLLNFFSYVNCQSHTLRSGTHGKLYLPRPRGTFFLNCLNYAGASLWNCMPDKIRNARNIMEFKYLYKRYILDSVGCMSLSNM